MLDLEDLKLVQKKGEKAFKLDYEKKNEKLIQQIEKDFVKSLERNDEYFELDINNYKGFKKTEEDFMNLKKYLDVKGFTTYCPNNDLINVHLNIK
ncbi:TPA: hypothetical protein N2D16_002767 [Clostridium botulinum]|nr:hypothetical protein [Clostridium botulinum]HCL4455145.1 hypothetical protein [Clostridium botulinum]